VKKIAVLFLTIVNLFFSLFCATNYFASSVKDRGILGDPHFGPFYEPFHIFWWRFKIKSGLAVSFSTSLYVFLMVFALLLTLTLFLYTRFKTKLRGMYGSSRWMTEREMKFQGLYTQHFDSVIFGMNKEAGYRQSGAEKYELKHPGKIIFNNENGHIYVNGPTRSGKGISIIVPTLLSYTESVFVYDIKKENFEKTAGWRKKFSHVVKLEFANPESAHFNVMSYVKKGDTEISELQNIIGNLTNPGGEEQDYDYWVESAKNLILAGMLHLLYSQDDPHSPPASLPGVRVFLLSQGKEETVKIMSEAKHILNSYTNEYETHPEVKRICVEMMNKSDKELAGVFGSATSYLGLFADPIVAGNTNDSDFELRDMFNGEHPMSLYLCVKPKDRPRMKPLVRMLIQSLSDVVMESVAKKKHTILALIDEFNSLGRMPFFETNIAYYMGYGMRCMVVCQGFNQLFGTYGRDTSILDNCRFKLVLGVSTPDDAKVVSEYLGTFSIAKSSISKSGNIGTFISAGRSESVTEAEQKLMTEEAILHMPYEDWLLITNGRYPYRGKKIMYYLDRRFSPRVLEAEIPDTRVQQIAEMPRRLLEQKQLDGRQLLLIEDKSGEEVTDALPAGPEEPGVMKPLEAPEEAEAVEGPPGEPEEEGKAIFDGPEIEDSEFEDTGDSDIIL
jgi:type IV secretion system protein VirD4